MSRLTVALVALVSRLMRRLVNRLRRRLGAMRRWRTMGFRVDLGRSMAAQGGVSGAKNLAVGEVKGPLWVVFRFPGHTVVDRKKVVGVGQAG